ncbi:MAG: hypothetical protein HC883_03495 [Bdellovibrionaceae bacterium]|nr:hypothetical protein [Pseudobdellovibrionaceae bacterium]
MKVGNWGLPEKGKMMGSIKFNAEKSGYQEELYFLKREKELIEKLRRRAHLELVKSDASSDDPHKGPTRIKR